MLPYVMQIQININRCHDSICKMFPSLCLCRMCVACKWAIHLRSNFLVLIKIEIKYGASYNYKKSYCFFVPLFGFIKTWNN